MTTVSAHAASLGVTRLCHLTPFRNLLHIASGAGVRSVADLNADERSAFTQQDLERFDNHPDHISCSVQYPNVWYLRQKLRSLTTDQLFFPDWVCLFITPDNLDRPGVLSCHRNAAAAGGALLKPGLDAFKAMYDDPVNGSRGPIGRGRKPASCPTDDQAEVMIPKFIPLAHCSHIAVRSEEQALRIYGALDLVGAPVAQLSWTIAADLFETASSGTLRAGGFPTERRWSINDTSAHA